MIVYDLQAVLEASLFEPGPWLAHLWCHIGCLYTGRWKQTMKGNVECWLLKANISNITRTWSHRSLFYWLLWTRILHRCESSNMSPLDIIYVTNHYCKWPQTISPQKHFLHTFDFTLYQIECWMNEIVSQSRLVHLRWLSNKEAIEEPPKTIPASAVYLSTRAGLLFNELQFSPEPVPCCHDIRVTVV